jgi:hypothetical protein
MRQRTSPDSPPAPAVVNETVPVSGVVQVIVSVVIGLHLLAVFLAPLMFATRGSPAARPLFTVLEPYIDLMYLNHGYFFFAPDPGPNHLVRYELEFADGRKPLVGEFPDRHEQWPRLLYHRHFMLAESYNNFYRSPRPEPEPRRPQEDSRAARRNYERQKRAWDAEYALWQRARGIYDKLQLSIGDHLKQTHGADSLVLLRREHRPLEAYELLEDRWQLTDDQTYRILPEVPATEVLPWNPSPRR